MKIWLISSNRWNSAITEYAVNSALAFERLGYEVLFSPLKYSPAETRARGHGFQVKPFVSFSLLAVLRFRRLYKQIHPDVVVCFGGPETTLLKCLSKSPNTRFLRFRGEAFSQREQIAGSLAAKRLEFSYASLDKLIFPGRCLLDQAERIFGPNPPKEAFPVGVDLDPPSLPKKEGDSQAPPYVVLLGRLDPVKGHEFFLGLFAKMIDLCARDGILQPKLLLIGEEASLRREQILKKISKENLQSQVEFISERLPKEKLFLLLQGASFGVVPSLGSEWIGRVSEEFLLLGTPVFLSRVGTLEELIFPGAGESFDPKEDEQKLAAQITSFYKRCLRESKSEKERRQILAQERFSMEAFARSWQKALG